MAAASSHRIRQLRWRVLASSSAEAFAIRGRVRDQWQPRLLPALERGLDAIADGEKVVHIQTLALRLRVGSEDELLDMLPELIGQQLREKLHAVPPDQARSSPGTPMWKESTWRQGRFETLLQYLHRGSVPWQAVTASATEVATGLKESVGEEWPRLLGYLHDRAVSVGFYFRLLHILSAAEAGTVVNSVAERVPQTWRIAMIEVITSVLGSGQRLFSRHTQLTLAAAFLMECRKNQERSIAPDFLPIAERWVTSTERKALELFVASLPRSAAPLLERKGETDYDCQDSPVGRPAAAKEVTQPFRPYPDRVPPPPTGDHAKDVPPDFSCLTRDSGRAVSAEDAFTLTISDAGLIVLHPFIVPLFERTRVKEAGLPQISPFLMARAAALLHFLATGREEVYEFELGFIKILLGLHPETALPVSAGLVRRKDKKESSDLLKSVITHWRVLKSTSVQGLRASFLQRKGILREVENGWELHVERKAFDMLLDQLPWSISVVKLPWMHKPIYVEW